MEFQKKVEEILKRDYFKEDKTIQITGQTVTKNNNFKINGISIKKDTDRIAPTFYIDAYKEQGYTEEAAAQAVYEAFLKQRKQVETFDKNRLEQLTDFKAVKDSICYKVINKEQNGELLEKVPSVDILQDLSAIFYIRLDQESTCMINKNITDIWGLNNKVEQQLFELADKNTQRLNPVSFQSMDEVIREITGIDMKDENVTVPMYVLTNQNRTLGASTLLYGGGTCLQECERMMKQELQIEFDGFYILPSSVHELILVPNLPEMDKEELKKMVVDTNQTQVEVEERLSDNIFWFDKDNGLKQITLKQIDRGR